MFFINKYRYIDKKTRNKFEIYSRSEEFADKLIERINKLGVFSLRRAKIRFCRKLTSETPPYDVELEQEATIRGWEEKAKKTNQ